MIKTYQILLNELKNYKNPKTKIQRMVKNGEIFYIVKGLYDDKKDINPFFYANPIYSPSYISFETALSYYGLIPERVYVIKNATFLKKKKKTFKTKLGYYMYQDVPKKAFSFGTEVVRDNDYFFYIASKEKALLDFLYSSDSFKNLKEIKKFIFNDMRVNEILLKQLNKNTILELSKLYNSKNIKLFINLINKEKLYD